MCGCGDDVVDKRAAGTSTCFVGGARGRVVGREGTKRERPTARTATERHSLLFSDARSAVPADRFAVLTFFLSLLSIKHQVDPINRIESSS